MTPAETLTAAATKLRAAATAATPSPWSWDRWHSSTCPPDCNDPACFLLLVGSPHGMVGSADVDRPEVFAVERSVQDGGEADAAYIALMHPGVGLPIADWLDATAKEMTNADGTEYAHSEYASWTAALAVARAILGEVTE